MANLPYTRLQLRRGNKTWWETNNPILAEGEPGVEIELGTGSKKTKTKMKVGDGVHPWKELSYMSGSGGGGGAVTCTLKSNKTVFEYGSNASFTLSMTITGDYDKYELKLNNEIISQNDYQEVIENINKTINALQESKTFSLIAYSDGNEISKSSIKIQPGYYIYYWSDSVDNNSSSTMNIPNSAKKLNGLKTSVTSQISAPEPFSPQNKAQLFIAVPSIWKDPIISNSGFVCTPNKEWDTTINYNSLTVDYKIYSIGDVGISEGTIIDIKS